MSGRVREGGQDRRWSLGFIGGSFIGLDYLARLLAQTFGSDFWLRLLAQTFGSGFGRLIIEASIVGVHGLMEFFGHAAACRSGISGHPAA
jgi:hypothetical protein